MKILHLAIDEKFIPFVQGVFESAFPGSNEFRVIRPAGAVISFVKPDRNVRYVSESYWFSWALNRDLRWADCLVVHFMSHWFSRAILGAPPDMPIVWHGWGADYYGLLDGYADRLRLPLTEALCASMGGEKARDADPPSYAQRVVNSLLSRFFFRDWMRRVLERVDVVSMLPDEFAILQRSQPRMQAVFHQLYCSSVEDSFSQGAEVMCGPDLLVGNSATPTNNHLDAFEALRFLDLDGRKVVVPLSYGEKEYADAVCFHGRRLFGDRFIPLRDYLPPAEYSERISTCGFLFMNHVRQQATGTVSLAMFKGAKVFLRSENLLFPFYRSQGAHIYRFPALPGESVDSSDDTFCPLSQRQRDENRHLVAGYWSRAKIVAQTRQLQELVGKKTLAAKT